jgi:cytochrome P450
MTATTTRDQLSTLPVAALATRPDAASWHAALRSLGTHAHNGQWVVSTPPDVAAALTAPALRAVPPAAAAGPAAELVARMARFCDGAAHLRRRALTVRLLPPVTEVAFQAADLAARYLRQQGPSDQPSGPLDVMPLARTLPSEAIARAIGLSELDAARAADLTGRLCDALAAGPYRAGSARTAFADADQAATDLCVTLRPLGLSDEDEVAAAASLLFQARDATAALIGAAVLAAAGSEHGLTAVLIESVLRRDAPVQCTRRTAAADATIGAVLIPRGSDVWIFMAAAEIGNGTPATFGSGPHGCPAATVATAIVREVLTVLHGAGWRPVAGQCIDYEARPNLRMPRRVLVSRR